MSDSESDSVPMTTKTYNVNIKISIKCECEENDNVFYFHNVNCTHAEAVLCNIKKGIESYVLDDDIFDDIDLSLEYDVQRSEK